MKIPRENQKPSNWSSQRDRRHDDLNVDGEVLSIQVASWHCAPDICKDMSSKSCHLSQLPKPKTLLRIFDKKKRLAGLIPRLRSPALSILQKSSIKFFNPGVSESLLHVGVFFGWKRDKALHFALQPLQPRYWNVYSSQAIGMANSNNAVTMWAFLEHLPFVPLSGNNKQNCMSNQHQHHLVRPVPSIIHLSWVRLTSSIFELLGRVSPHAFNSIYWQVQ